MDQIMCFTSAKNPVAKELGKLMKLNAFTGEEEAAAYLLEIQVAPADIDWLAVGRKTHKPIILLDVPKNMAVRGCVVSIPSRASLLLFEEEYVILQVLDTPCTLLSHSEGDITVNLEERTFTAPAERELSDAPKRSYANFRELAYLIHSAVTKEAVEELRRDMARLHSARNDTMCDVSILPYPQYKKQYTCYNWSYPVLDANANTTQSWKVSAVFEFALFASYAAENKSKKYLRVAALNQTEGQSTLFDTGNLTWDGSYDRGYFNNTIKYSTSSPNTDLVCNDVNPSSKTSGDYNSSYCVEVGVDKAKYPNYKANYLIGNAISFTGNGFCRWGSKGANSSEVVHNLSLTDGDKFNIFSSSFMRKGKVKELPATTKQTFSPLFQVLYQCPAFIRESVELQCVTYAEILRAYVTGNWASYTEHWTSWYYEVINAGCTVNFGDVSC